MEENDKLTPEKNERDNARQFEQDILDIVRGNHPAAEMKELLADYHDNDIAHSLPLLEENERRRLYAVLDNDALSDVFSYLDDPQPFVEELTSEKAADIVESMASDDAVDLLQELDEDKKQEIIQLMDEESARDVQRISRYDEDEIGSLMTNDFVCVEESLTIKEAMRKVIEAAADNENILTIFVVRDKVFKGAFKLRDLVIARSSTSLSSIIVTSFPYLYAHDKTADVLSDIKDYAEDSLPILDDDNRLIGALTSADVVEAVDDALADDYAKLAGLTGETEEDEPIMKGVVKRLPWLVTLLCLDLFIGAYVGIFEAVIVSLPFIACFQQLISGMSGNTGTQSLAVAVRVLSEGLEKGETRRLIFKEVRVGFFNGLITGIIAAAGVGIYSFLSGSVAGFANCALTGAAVGSALLVSTTFSALTGSFIPAMLLKLKADPAVASGPLITTINDLTAISVYYGLALLLLSCIA